MKSFLMLCGAATCALAALPAAAQQAPAPVAPAATAPAPVSELVKAVDIPYQRFTLPNGLRVIVHTDRKAPIVAVAVWYDVGSKFEPAGKTGFAHLFEHLMFNGIGERSGRLLQAAEGSRRDRFQRHHLVRPHQLFRDRAAPRARSRAVPRKRPDGLAHRRDHPGRARRAARRRPEREAPGRQPALRAVPVPASTSSCFAGTGYGHTMIGSMADLDAASLDDVKSWFKSHYGPNNAVLVLAGDIDAAEARPLVEKYFGAIPAGPRSVRAGNQDDPDARRAQDRDHQGPRRRDLDPAYLGGPRPQRQGCDPARRGGERARRALELAARQRAGP